MKIINRIIAVLIISLNIYFVPMSIDLLMDSYALAERGVQGTDMMGVRFPLMLLLIFHVFIIPSIITLLTKFYKSIVILIINGLGLVWGFFVLFVFYL